MSLKSRLFAQPALGSLRVQADQPANNRTLAPSADVMVGVIGTVVALVAHSHIGVHIHAAIVVIHGLLMSLLLRLLLLMLLLVSLLLLLLRLLLLLPLLSVVRRQRLVRRPSPDARRVLRMHVLRFVALPVPLPMPRADRGQRRRW